MSIISLRPDGLFLINEYGVISTNVTDEDFFRYWEKEINVIAGTRLLDLLLLLQKMSQQNREILADMADVDINAIIAAGLQKPKCETITDTSVLVAYEKIILKKTDPFDMLVKNIPARAHRSTPEIIRDFFFEGKIFGPPEELVNISDTPIIELINLPLTVEHSVKVDVSELIPFGPLHAHKAMTFNDFILAVLDELKLCNMAKKSSTAQSSIVEEETIEEKKLSEEKDINYAGLTDEDLGISNVEVMPEKLSKKEKKEIKKLKKSLKKKMKKDIKAAKKLKKSFKS